MCVKTLYHRSADIYQNNTFPTHRQCASFQKTVGNGNKSTERSFRKASLEM